MTAQRARKASPAERVIDGEAVLIGRRALAAAEIGRREPEPTNDNGPVPLAFPAHRRSRPDLVYPGCVRWRPAQTNNRRLFERRLAGTRLPIVLAALAAVSIACGAVAWRGAAIPARFVAPAAAFELTQTLNVVEVRGADRVLVVAGRIRNLSARPAPPPGVSVEFGKARLHGFRPSVALVRPGASVSFHSTLALPSATSGERAVLSLEAEAKGSS